MTQPLPSPAHGNGAPLDAEASQGHADSSYAGFDDAQKIDILKSQGIASDEAGVLAAIERGASPVQTAAAHVAGALGFKQAIPVLKSLLGTSDDFVRIEAAYALVRLGVPKARQVLVDCLSLPLEAYVTPPIAGGYLARMGDPQGFEIVAHALASRLTAVRSVGCKQLFFFVPWHGQPGRNGQTIDVFALFGRALQDADQSVQWLALQQLSELRRPEARPHLEAFVARSTDGPMHELARTILRG